MIRPPDGRNFEQHVYFGRHRGVFKYWPRVFELWWTRRFGPELAGFVDFKGKQFQDPPNDAEMAQMCGRR